MSAKITTLFDSVYPPGILHVADNLLLHYFKVHLPLNPVLLGGLKPCWLASVGGPTGRMSWTVMILSTERIETELLKVANYRLLSAERASEEHTYVDAARPKVIGQVDEGSTRFFSDSVFDWRCSVRQIARWRIFTTLSFWVCDSSSMVKHWSKRFERRLNAQNATSGRRACCIYAGIRDWQSSTVERIHPKESSSGRAIHIGSWCHPGVCSSASPGIGWRGEVFSPLGTGRRLAAEGMKTLIRTPLGLRTEQLPQARRYSRLGIDVKIVGNTDIGVPESLAGGMDAVRLIDQWTVFLP
jgi:hypothetical protein